MKTWVKHYTDVHLRDKVIRVMRVTYNAKQPHHKKKNRQLELVKVVPIVVDIPFEEVMIKKEFFDSRAIQSSDRFYTEEVLIKRPSVSFIRGLSDQALEGFNTEPQVVE